ncbi:MAG: Grx4 family monothiol glutaredoxin [Deltaproteobacteria bacterium]|nr:Grx4 family monothiol glutaredoxin [Deltaproteobacteria bacterium]
MTSAHIKDQNALNQRIQTEITENPVILYMKGDKTFPQCGFSARVVEILNKVGVPYQTHDVISDPELRFGMKYFSNWPTFPQLFIKGELVGGCDIVANLFETGELQNLLKEKGLLTS